MIVQSGNQLRALLAARLQFEMVSFLAVLFIFSLIIHIASLLCNYDKKVNHREATRAAEKR